MSFHELWKKYAHDVYRFSLSLCGNPSMAEDLTSEAFLRAWVAKDRILALTVKAYLLSIARNLYLHEIRKHGRDDAVDPGLPAPGSPVRAAEEREQLRLALEGMLLLPEIDRAALLLRVQHDLSYEDIGAALGLPVSTARVKVHRARLRLAEICQRNLV